MDAKNALAHISEDGTRTQTIISHLEGTARLAAEFARIFGNENMVFSAVYWGAANP